MICAALELAHLALAQWGDYEWFPELEIWYYVGLLWYLDFNMLYHGILLGESYNPGASWKPHQLGSNSDLDIHNFKVNVLIWMLDYEEEFHRMKCASSIFTVNHA